MDENEFSFERSKGEIRDTTVEGERRAKQWKYSDYGYARIRCTEVCDNSKE